MTQETKNSPIVVTKLDFFTQEEFGPKASNQLLALQPTRLEVGLVLCTHMDIRGQYEGKKDSFFPSPTQILLFDRNFIIPDENRELASGSQSLLDVMGEVFSQYRKHCELVNRPKPSLSESLEYAVRLAETGTLATFNVGYLKSAPALERLNHVLSRDEVTVPGTRSPDAIDDDASDEVPLVTKNPVGADLSDLKALSLITTIPAGELSVLPIGRDKLLAAVTDYNLKETDIRDLIHIEQSERSASTALAILKAGHTMETVRMIDEVQCLVEGTFGNIALPEMMRPQRMEASERKELLSSLRVVSVEAVIAFAHEFDLSGGEEVAEKMVEVAEVLDPKGKLSMVRILDDIIDRSQKQPAGTKGYLDRVLDLYREDNLDRVLDLYREDN